MRRFFIYLIVLILPQILLVLFIPVNKKYRYKLLENDCFNHASWIYCRIFENKTPVDIAFYGSSHTISGINDRLIQTGLRDTSLHVANFGYCRLGNNLNYVLLQDLLKTKHPQLVIIEVRGDEDQFSHPLFPYLADERDVFMPKLFFNKDFFSDYFVAFTFKIQILQKIIFDPIREPDQNCSLFGYAATGDTAEYELLEEAKKKHMLPAKKMGKMEREFKLKYPRSYNEKFYKICSANGIRICFIYLPNYAPRFNRPLEYKNYRKHGPILIPPDSVMSNVNYWGDDEHMNKTGADHLAEWISGELNNLIKP
jgi:hypothetical protein